MQLDWDAIRRDMDPGIARGPAHRQPRIASVRDGSLYFAQHAAKERLFIADRGAWVRVRLAQTVLPARRRTSSPGFRTSARRHGGRSRSRGRPRQSDDEPSAGWADDAARVPHSRLSLPERRDAS